MDCMRKKHCEEDLSYLHQICGFIGCFLIKTFYLFILFIIYIFIYLFNHVEKLIKSSFKTFFLKVLTTDHQIVIAILLYAI